MVARSTIRATLPGCACSRSSSASPWSRNAETPGESVPPRLRGLGAAILRCFESFPKRATRFSGAASKAFLCLERRRTEILGTYVR